MSSTFINWPVLEIPTFPNAAALPIPFLDGGIASTTDTYTLYMFDAQSQTWITVGGGAVPLSVGTLDGQAPSANGATIALNKLFLQSASTSNPGLVNNTTQSFSGNKTFTGTISASNLSGTNTGDVTLGTANGLSLMGQVLSLGLSSTSTTGALSSTDWNTFNNKQSTLTIGNLTDAGTDGITVTGGTGAVIGSGVSLSQHVADTTHNGYLSSTDWNTFNGKQSALTIGNITDVGTDGITVTGGTGAIIGSGVSLSQHIADTTHNGYLSSTDWNTFNGKQAAGSYITALTGDVTASGPGSAAATLATVNSNVGSFTYASLTVNAKGLITAASNGTAPVTTLSAVGASPNANAATISGNTLNLQPFDSTHPGVVPSSGGGTTNFLRADGTWAIPSGSGGVSVGVASDLTFVNFGSVTNHIVKVTLSSIFQYEGNVTGLTTSANTATVALGTPINTTYWSSTQTQVGTWQSLETATLTQGTLFYDGSDVNNIYFALTTDGSKNYLKLNTNTIANAGETLQIRFSYPT